MSELVGLIEWAFGGFWRWLGFFLLVTAIGGATRGVVVAFFSGLRGLGEKATDVKTP